MKSYDVLIVGGGPAGLSAAMSLGRMGRTVLVTDDGRPRNAAADHMNNFPSADGMAPGEWRNSVRRDLNKYASVHFRSDTINSIATNDNMFSVNFGDGEIYFRKIILAYGVQDQVPTLPGFRELWGKSVFHCPYCHGFEVRGQRLGLIANGKFAEHLLPMILGLSKDVVLFTNEKLEASEDFQELIEKNKIQVMESAISNLNYSGSKLNSVRLKNQDDIPRDGIFLAPKLPFQLKSDIGDRLGCERTELGFYKKDLTGKTTVANIFAAGDITTMMHSVLASAASGQLAGAAVAGDLLMENFRKT